MTVFGLPFHPLIVHATVVVVPTAALAVLVSTFPRWLVVGGAALSAVGAVGSLVEVVLIGHSGAAATLSQNA